MSDNQYVLVLYDIRAKQNFIFRTNHMKEIIGASAIIRDCFKDYLFPQARQVGKGIFPGENDVREPFSRETFERHLADGYIGEVVYDGGGNFILLYKDVETYRKITYEFTKEVLKKVGTLRVLSSYIEGVDFDDYKEDSRKLYATHAVNENKESNIAPWSTLPIVQVDRRTSMPLVGKLHTEDGKEKLSKESIAKIEKYHQEAKERQSEFDEKQIDRLVRKKGEDSLLAIVYIDGNNMGAQVQQCIAGKQTYEECVAALRDFSLNIQKNYIDDRKENLFEFLDKKANKSSMYKWRLVLGAGDEINFICNAHDAFDLARTYLERLPKGCSSCAGIAVFHSHAPYADVYRIAEECCKSGKQLMKELGIKDANFIDFHYCQSAIDVSLEQIRQTEDNEKNSLPWFIPRKPDHENRTFDKESDMQIIKSIHEKGKFAYEDVKNMLELLHLMGRSNVKGLATVAKESLAALRLDLKRIEAHMNENNREMVRQLAEEKGINIDKLSEEQRRLIYDLSTSYDLWFKGEKDV